MIMSIKRFGGTVEGIFTVDRYGDDVQVEVSGYYTPAQNGGETDPSWSAYVTLEYSSDLLTREEMREAEQYLLSLVEG